MHEFFEANDLVLDFYTLAMTKAHGAHHPEVFEVRKIYQQIEQKMRSGDSDLTKEFARLRTVTDHYTIPSDACGVYAATYQALEQMDHVASRHTV